MKNLKHYTFVALAAAALFANPAYATGASTTGTSTGATSTAVTSGADLIGHFHMTPGRRTFNLEYLWGIGWRMAHGVSVAGLPRQPGFFNFSKVSGADVYFGEWSQNGHASHTTHTVYYWGKSSRTTVPTSGFATYSVKGLNDYYNKGVLSGTINARFIGTGGILRGTLENNPASALASNNNARNAKKHTLDIGTARINGVNFSGTDAMAAYGSNVVTGGQVSGRFFGVNAKALAGMVTFPGNKQYDTAFGGAKN